MKLRQRLALTTLVSAVPIVLLLLWGQSRLDRRSTEAALTQFILAEMQRGGRERCEAEPDRYPRPDPVPGPRPSGPPGPAGPLPSGPGSWAPRPPAGDPRPPGPPPAAEPRGPGRPARRADPGPNPLIAPPLVFFAYDERFESANPRAPRFPASLRTALDEGRDAAAGSFRAQNGQGTEVALRMEWTTGPCRIVLARIGPRGEPVWRLIAPPIAVGFAFVLAVLVSSGAVVGRIRRLTTEVRAAAQAHYARPVTVTGDDEISALARSFNEAGEAVQRHVGAIEQRERTLRRFVANTTHDLATPLTVLQGHLSAMRQQAAAGGVSADEVRAALEESHYLASLVQNLAAAAKLEAGAPHVQRHPVDLGSLIERVVARHRPVAEARRVELDFGVPDDRVAVSGDVTLLEQAVSNLVDNAVRYNHAGGHVAVVLESTSHPPSFMLRVIDDGPGAPDEQLSRLAERHFRGDAARTRRPDGLGLGLDIASEVSRQHGFTLSFRRSAAGGLEAALSGPALHPDSAGPTPSGD